MNNAKLFSASIDYPLNCSERIPFNSFLSLRRVIISDALPHPFGLTLLSGDLYWTDWNEAVVQRADKNAGSEDRDIIIAHLNDLMGVHAAKVEWDEGNEEGNQCAKGQLS